MKSDRSATRNASTPARRHGRRPETRLRQPQADPMAPSDLLVSDELTRRAVDCSSGAANRRACAIPPERWTTLTSSSESRSSLRSGGLRLHPQRQDALFPAQAEPVRPSSGSDRDRRDSAGL
jgi:hypothetical protein